MNSYDVIIIGAGPGGSSAARLLAENNLKVLLLEKYKTPRTKACAGGLPYHLTEFIDFDISDKISSISDTTVFTFKHKKSVKIKNEKIKINMVMREDFDSLLIEKAIENVKDKLGDSISYANSMYEALDA